MHGAYAYMNELRLVGYNRKQNKLKLKVMEGQKKIFHCIVNFFRHHDMTNSRL